MAASLDISGDFPILARQVNGQPLTYLDSAATTQKPQAVIDAIRHYYERRNANVHRAAHALAEEATAAMEDARAKVAALVGAGDARELIFTRGATEGINLVAAGLTDRLGPGDEVLITELEHHSNIVPWQMLCQRSGAALVACRVTATGEIDLSDFHAKLRPRTKLVAIGHVSNALGTVNPVAALIEAAHAQGALALIDGAQAVQHLDVDVGRLGCDFYAFSAHKLFGPTGIGALYGRAALLEELPPYQGGGEMIEHVSIERTIYNQPPYKFEAGTPNIAGAVGFGAAADYLAGLPRQALRDREAALVSQAVSRLKQIPGLRMVGEPRERVSVVSFLVDGGHPHDFGTLLDQQGIAVRTGHHCAMPLMERLGVPGTIRASFALYNSPADVERLVAGVEKAIEFV
ncbi:MAG: SufS family cysteine desulfurase [Gammaproteobacteria bacterium]|nr:SufS family cysteine desulfurase [Gammaproteobacteria bacterium]